MLSRPLVVLAALVTIALLLFGCQQAQPTAAPTKGPATAPAAKQAETSKEAAKSTSSTARAGWPEKIRLASGPQGGSFFVFSSAWANLLREKLGVNVSVEVTQGNNANVILMEDKKAELGLVSASAIYEAWTGTGWTKGTKYQGARAIIVSESSSLQFWTLADRGIKTVNDLNGKRVNLSQAGSGADSFGRKMFEVLGIKPARVTNVSHSDANQQLSDGLLDASLSLGGVPHPSISELALTKDVVVVEIPKEIIEKLRSTFPTLVPGEIPAGTYRGQNVPIPTGNDWFYLIGRAGLPNDFVYEITKVTFEGKPQLTAAYKSARDMAAENVRFLQAPLHRGAHKYYQEKGLTIPKDAEPVD